MNRLKIKLFHKSLTQLKFHKKFMKKNPLLMKLLISQYISNLGLHLKSKFRMSQSLLNLVKKRKLRKVNTK